MAAIVDLNADLGESFGAYTLGDDGALMSLITSANVACGFHAGDPLVMERTLRTAKQAGVAVGAHPGFPDRVGFGRRVLDATVHEIAADVAYQIGALLGIGRRVGIQVTHVKAHGALYNVAWRSTSVADAICDGVASVDPSLIVVVPAGSEFEAAARRAGLTVAREAFPDRGYSEDGVLVSRRVTGAVLSDPEEVAARAVRMVVDGKVMATGGAWYELKVDTLCIHGDNPEAVALAASVRRALEAAGVQLRSMHSFVCLGDGSENVL